MVSWPSSRGIPIKKIHAINGKYLERWSLYWNRALDDIIYCCHQQQPLQSPSPTTLFSPSGINSISHKTSSRNISQSFKDIILGVRIVQLLWHLTGVSAAVLLSHLPNFKQCKHFKTRCCAFKALQELTKRCLIYRHMILNYPGHLGTS